jgi:hypothetical protein
VTTPNAPSVQRRRGNRISAAEAFQSAETYGGLRLVDVGEDGAILILGHHDSEAVEAAWLAHARSFWGMKDADLADGPPDAERRWAFFTRAGEHDDYTWYARWGSTRRMPGMAAVTVMEP